jgi:probable rRNA maturation factor
LGCEEAEVSVVIVDDGAITALNRRYFRRRGPTNVISFPLREGTAEGLPPFLLGDVVISADTAERHARAAGIQTGEEILFLLVHGILHLAGYNHEGPAAERREMETKEREIFKGLLGGSGKERRETKGREAKGGQKKNRP